ncbi:ferrous iron transport protein A [Ruminococcaceae bacterium OttesenSCG-928-A16]|nr:ferrous iron transport protein A [Ruminococcaceae bacterium OttesenSCG-928-A16]
MHHSAVAHAHMRPSKGEARVHGAQLPFALATPGQPVVVAAVRGKDDTRRFLANLGFVEGATATVVCENGGNIIASVKDARVAISQAMAMRIMVG